MFPNSTVGFSTMEAIIREAFPVERDVKTFRKERRGGRSGLGRGDSSKLLPHSWCTQSCQCWKPKQ